MGVAEKLEKKLILKGKRKEKNGVCKTKMKFIDVNRVVKNNKSSVS